MSMLRLQGEARVGQVQGVDEAGIRHGVREDLAARDHR